MLATPVAMDRRRRWVLWGVLGVLGLIAAALAVRYLHPFLAVDAPVRANVLVVEGWLPEHALERAVAEARSGRYELVVISGMATSDGTVPGAIRARTFLQTAGLPPPAVEVVMIEVTRWNRTSTMARAVRDRLVELRVVTTGVNILSLGPHARQSLLAYSRMLGPAVATGVIQVPKSEYDPSHWWASLIGIAKTLTHFAGWARELAFGLRS